MIAALPSTPCYLNGHYTPLCDAKVSVMDRGFIFGDGIYEVVPAYGGVPFRFDEHMARLERSLSELRIPNPLSRPEWRAVVQRLLDLGAEARGAPLAGFDQIVYMQITRGVALRDHAMIPGLEPTVFAMASVMNGLDMAQRQRGVACVTADDFRWRKAHIKSTSLLGAVFARQISVDAGAAETIMFRDGFLSEAAASNVWIVKDGGVLGVPKDNLVLEGIRFGLLEELCQAAGLPFTLRRITRDEVLGADEVLLSSATKEVLAVTTLDGQPVGHPSHRGQPGPMSQRLFAAYQEAKRSSAAAAGLVRQAAAGRNP